LEHREEDGREVTSPQRVAEARARIAGRLVGRERELDLVLAAVAVGRDMLLERPGPPRAPCGLARSGRRLRLKVAAAWPWAAAIVTPGTGSPPCPKHPDRQEDCPCDQGRNLGPWNPGHPARQPTTVVPRP
jgi:hypothetical protein